MEKENEVLEVVDVPEIVETKDADGNDTTDWKAIALERTELAKKNAGIGKRYKTKFEKSKEVIVPEKKDQKSDGNELLFKRIDKLALQGAGIKDADEVELAENFKQRTGLDIEAVVSDDIFQAKLEKLRANKANIAATAGVKGGGGDSGAKSDPAYWLAKGVPPTPADISDRKIRAKIIRAFMQKASGSGIKFYNE